jgi:hypothetical protein
MPDRFTDCELAFYDRYSVPGYELQRVPFDCGR